MVIIITIMTIIMVTIMITPTTTIMATIIITIIMAMIITIIGSQPTMCAGGLREMPGAKASGRRSSRA